MCNGSKGEEDHRGALIRPDVEDPEPFFWIHPDTGALEPHPSLDTDGIRRARETIRICNLQRSALCTKRVQTLRKVARWLERLANDETPQLLKDEWGEMSDPRAEYKLVLRHFLRARGQALLAEADRSQFERPR
jgi:hypothetical protein